MAEKTLKELVVEYNREIKEALLLMYNELNHGQKQKIMKSERVQRLFERYGIDGVQEEK